MLVRDTTALPPTGEAAAAGLRAKLEGTELSGDRGDEPVAANLTAKVSISPPPGPLPGLRGATDAIGRNE